MAYSKTSWFNKPSTASPINASNLNKIENGIDINSRYITATAGSDGDFYINIASYTTLTAGLKLNITLPAATVPTANARLSIDGGANYKNLLDINGGQLIASEVQGRKLRFVYDGTGFRCLDTIYGSTVNGNYQKMPCGTMIITHRVTYNIAVTSTWGSLFTSTQFAPFGNFPKTFIAAPTMSFNVEISGGWQAWISCGTSTPPSTTNAGNVVLVRGTTSTSARDFSISYQAIGRWY